MVNYTKECYSFKVITHVENIDIFCTYEKDVSLKQEEISIECRNVSLKESTLKLADEIVEFLSKKKNFKKYILKSKNILNIDLSYVLFEDKVKQKIKKELNKNDEIYINSIIYSVITEYNFAYRNLPEDKLEELASDWQLSFNTVKDIITLDGLMNKTKEK